MIHDSIGASITERNMRARPEDLPDFERPPVTEVVLSVQFERIAGFQAVHTGQLWEKFRSEFPVVQEHPQLDATFETFGTKQTEAGVKLELVPGPGPLPRLWFLNEERTQLIQFQQDRFVHNWRKVGKEDVYPRYESIKSLFLDELRTLERVFHDLKLGELKPNQCEVTYVNQIVSEAEEDLWSQPEAIFPFFSNNFAPEVFDKLEDARFQFRFVMYDEQKNPIGRLYANAQPRLSNDGRRTVALTLTARGSPSAPTLDATSKFLDHGREKVVKSFAELTSRSMHELWGRKQ